MPSTSSSGWNCVAYTFAPTRNICTGQVGDDASSVAESGSELMASLCPTKALNVGGSSARIGSDAPASVSVTGTTLIGSAKVRSIGAPWWTPRVPTP